MNINFRSISILWIIYFLLAFPSFYFVYKFGNPDFGTNDFFSYYKLYKDWDLDHVEAPFNMRLVSSFFVYLFNKIGFNYNTATAFDVFGLEKQVFFNAIFFNFLCVATTCIVIFATIRKFVSSFYPAFIGGLIYLFGFGTLFYEFMPITDAFSVLVFSMVFYLYLRKSYWIVFFLVLLILQREYVFLALGLISLIDYVKYKIKYHLQVLFVCIGCFLIYYVLRKTVFYTPRFDHQASADFFIDSLLTIKFPLVPYIKQTLMTLNIIFVYLIILLIKKVKKMPIDNFYFFKIILLFIQINVISFAAVFGNNTGRYFYILVPYVIFVLITEAYPLLKRLEN